VCQKKKERKNINIFFAQAKSFYKKKQFFKKGVPITKAN
jgi:hypothetical protein